MTTRKKLKKMAQRRTAKAKTVAARRAFSWVARSIVRAMPRNAFASMDDCREETRQMANTTVLSGDPAPADQDRREMVEQIFDRAEHLLIPELGRLAAMGGANLEARVIDTLASLYMIGACHGIEVTIWPGEHPQFPMDFPPDIAPEHLMKAFTDIYWCGYDRFYQEGDHWTIDDDERWHDEDWF